jgi:hypothetical protein
MHMIVEVDARDLRGVVHVQQRQGVRGTAPVSVHVHRDGAAAGAVLEAAVDFVARVAIGDAVLERLRAMREQRIR